jgi:hypothetical protein
MNDMDFGVFNLNILVPVHENPFKVVSADLSRTSREEKNHHRSLRRMVFSPVQ